MSLFIMGLPHSALCSGVWKNTFGHDKSGSKKDSYHLKYQYEVCTVPFHCLVCSVQCAVFRVEYLVCSVQCSEQNIQCAVCSVHCVVFFLCSVQFSLCSVQCTVYTVQCTVYSCPTSDKQGSCHLPILYLTSHVTVRLSPPFIEHF